MGYGNMGGWAGHYPALFNVGGVVLGAAIGLVFVVLALWSLFWKGMALWKAARLGQKGWFVALLLINTLGILDILYIYIFSKKKTPLANL